MSFSHGTIGRTTVRGAQPMVIHNSVPGTGTPASTAETILATVTIPKGAIEVNGRAIRFTAFLSTAANANTKTVRVRLNGIAGLVVASFGGALNGGSIQLTGTIWRTAAATASSFGTGIPNSGSIAINGNIAQAVGNFDTADQTLVVTGQNGTAAANDAVLRAFMVEILSETPTPL